MPIPSFAPLFAAALVLALPAPGLLAQETDGPAALAPPAATSAVQDEPEAAPPVIEPLPDGVAARALNPDGSYTNVMYDELDALLLARHGKRAEGQDVLTRLLNMTVLRKLADEAGVQISSTMVDARIAELDERLRAEGMAGGIAEALATSDIDPKVFRDTLAVSLAQEELARIALEIPAGKRPDEGAQRAWMDEVMAARTEELICDPFPTTPGSVVARSNEVEITLEPFLEHLRDELPRAFVEQTCAQMILMKRMRIEAGEIPDAVWKEALGLELGRRAERHAADPQMAGITYEQLLDAQGLSLEKISRDPAVVVTALTSVLSWREAEAAAKEAGATWETAEAQRDAGRRVLYEREKEVFDGYYGERLHLRACLLRAVEVPNELVPRSIEDAHSYLKRLAPGIPDEEGFQLIVGKISEDTGAKETGGELGWFGRADGRLPEVVRKLAFDYWAENGAPGVAGPIDVVGGVALFWVGPHEPAPEWPVLSQAVQSELQARILRRTMPEAGIQIFRDPPMAPAK